MISDQDLTKLVCSLLGDVPGWLWWEDDDTPYPATSTGIFYGAIGTDPDRAIGVRVYGTTDYYEESLSSRRVQLRFRGRPHRVDDPDNLAQIAFLRLQGLSRVGGISGIRRDSGGGSPQADGNGRGQRTDNYTIILDNQEALQ